MIRQLILKDIGPARHLKFGFSPRLNVLTGDSGLGKTLVLDVLWWVLTTTWAGEKAFPFRSIDGFEGGGLLGASDSSPGRGTGPGHVSEAAPRAEPAIEAVLTHRHPDSLELIDVTTNGVWDWKSQEWSRGLQRFSRSTVDLKPDGASSGMTEVLPQSLVIYARIDGGFAVFDAQFVREGRTDLEDAALVLSASELWDGKEVLDPVVQGGKRTVIGGLIADWVRWQERSKSPEFDALRAVLQALSAPDEPLVPSEPTRVHHRDRRDIPTLATSYGIVPVTLASAGMKRALSLAYLLVWATAENAKAAHACRRDPARDVVLLIDEPELHQHPAWQRAFLPAILKAVGAVAPHADVQLFTATHSPLVLASLEPHFDQSIDALFAFDRTLKSKQVQIERLPWRPRGDVSNWLTSEVFDLTYARSREAEAALSKAVQALDQPDLTDDAARAIHHELQAALGDTDPFWARWLAYAETKGITP